MRSLAANLESVSILNRGVCSNCVGDDRSLSSAVCTKEELQCLSGEAELFWPVRRQDSFFCRWAQRPKVADRTDPRDPMGAEPLMGRVGQLAIALPGTVDLLADIQARADRAGIIESDTDHQVHEVIIIAELTFDSV